MTDALPDSLQKLPADLTAPQYQVLTLGPKEHPTSVAVVVDAPDGRAPRLFVDANANGDLTDDPALEWTRQESKGQNAGSPTLYNSSATVSVCYGEAAIPLHLAFTLYHYERSEESQVARKDVLLVSVESGYEGEVTLGGKTYPIRLADTAATGDFRGNTAGGTSGVLLLIDVNGNGVFDARGESFDIGQPFNIRGMTYEITDVSASGDTLTLRKSQRSVPEIPPPPDLRPGQKAVPFEKKTLDGQTVKFPVSYKGKLVLLYFWASWCGDCAAERPNLKKTYETFHAQGLEVLGISLDEANAAAQLAAFLKANNMPWPEVYDGKKWEADIAQLYFINWIPSAFLVDGDTGEILAAGDDLMGERLSETVRKALAARKQKPTL